MTYYEALLALRNGRKVRREDWPKSWTMTFQTRTFANGDTLDQQPWVYCTDLRMGWWFTPFTEETSATDWGLVQ